MINKFKKIFTVTTFTICLLSSSACSTVVGAYNNDPYGPVVNCDSELPINELLQCVDKQYAKMDSIYEHPFIKDDKIFNSEIRNDPVASNLLPLSVHKTSIFHPIKACYKEDKCEHYITKNKLGLVTYDNYSNRAVRTLDLNRTMMVELFIEKNINKIKDPYTQSYSLRAAPYQFVHSYKNKDRDVIIFKKNNQTYIFATLTEIVKLKDNKTLIISNIQKFCPPSLSKKPQYTPKDTYLKAHFDACGIYRFSFLTENIITNVPVVISLDRRVNPRKIYLKTGEDVFEIDIKQKGETK